VRGLARRMSSRDIVYLTARDPSKGRAALAQLAETQAAVEVQRVDVNDASTIERFAALLRERHGHVDIVASNAAARIYKEPAPELQVRAFVETNNHGSYRIMKALVPLLNTGARYVVIASVYGRLVNLAPHLRVLFSDAQTLEDIERIMDQYVDCVERGEAEAQGWPTWINVASKIGQVESTRTLARYIDETRGGEDILVNAVCPGLVDTEASRPWFDDSAQAQTPDQAAQSIVEVLLAPPDWTAPHGQLLRHGRPMRWRPDD